MIGIIGAMEEEVAALKEAMTIEENVTVEFFSQRMAGDIVARKATNATIAATLICNFF